MSLWHCRYMGQTPLIELLVIIGNVLLFLPSNQFLLLWHSLWPSAKTVTEHLTCCMTIHKNFTSLWSDPKPTEIVAMQKFFHWFLPWTRDWRFGIYQHRSPTLEKIFRVQNWSWNFGQEIFHVQKSMQTE